MKGDAKVIALLNDVLANELTAINQYFLHARICENWGYERLWKKVRARVDRRDEARRQGDRAHPLPGRASQPPEAREARRSARPSSSSCRATSPSRSGPSRCSTPASSSAARSGDNGTAELLEEILVDEEEHADWLEAQLTLVEQVGIQNYLAQQVKKEEE